MIEIISGEGVSNWIRKFLWAIIALMIIIALRGFHKNQIEDATKRVKNEKLFYTWGW